MVAKEQSEDKTINPLIAVRLCEYLEKKKKTKPILYIKLKPRELHFVHSALLDLLNLLVAIGN